jgi:hypothetical protein
VSLAANGEEVEHEQTKLLIPALRPFYRVEPAALGLVRITAGVDDLRAVRQPCVPTGVQPHALASNPIARNMAAMVMARVLNALSIFFAFLANNSIFSNA